VGGRVHPDVRAADAKAAADRHERVVYAAALEHGGGLEAAGVARAGEEAGVAARDGLGKVRVERRDRDAVRLREAGVDQVPGVIVVDE